MDIKEISKSLLSTANVKSITAKTGATATQVKSVLKTALPSILSGKKPSESEISKETGVEKAQTKGILSAAGPLLMGLLGGNSSQQSQPAQASGTAALLGSLLSNVDIGSLASSFFSAVSTDTSGDDEEEEEEEEKPKPKPKKPAAKKPAAKKPAAKKDSKKTDGKKTDGKKTSSKKTTSAKKTTKSSSPLDSVTDILGKLIK